MSERLSRNDVKKIASLVKITFDEAEIDQYLKEINGILNHFSKLSRLDLSEISPTSHISWSNPPMHEDTPDEWKEIDQVVQNAPETRAHFFVVPRIVDKKEGFNES